MRFVARTGRSVVIATLLLTAVSCTSDDGPERDAEGAVVTGGSLEAADLRVGDCFNGSEGEAVTTVDVVPCGDEHEFELYHRFDLPDGDYPGSEALEDRWLQGCLAEFEAFVGVSFDESMLDISGIIPTERTWTELDDREVLCSVTPLDDSPLVGSVRGTLR
ncbi:MAG: septum formation family protein [Acidimicrobiales bacterium]